MLKKRTVAKGIALLSKVFTTAISALFAGLSGACAQLDQIASMLCVLGDVARGARCRPKD